MTSYWNHGNDHFLRKQIWWINDRNVQKAKQFWTVNTEYSCKSYTRIKSDLNIIIAHCCSFPVGSSTLRLWSWTCLGRASWSTATSASSATRPSRRWTTGQSSAGHKTSWENKGNPASFTWCPPVRTTTTKKLFCPQATHSHKSSFYFPSLLLLLFEPPIHFWFGDKSGLVFGAFMLHNKQ